MEKALNPFQCVVIVLAGWMNQRQQNVIEYLREENRILREQLGDRRLRFNDDQRRRLAVRAKGLGRKLLMEIATLVTPATLFTGEFRVRCPIWGTNAPAARSPISFVGTESNLRPSGIEKRLGQNFSNSIGS